MESNRFGLSGANLIFSRNSVRKYMDNPQDQAARLTNINGIRTPDITYLSSRHYTMTRVAGDNLVGHLNANPRMISHLFHVMDWIIGNLNRSKILPVDISIFHDKLESIHNACFDKLDVSVLNRLRRLIERSNETILMPIGQTHGDPTLENIMASNNETYLIDPIPSFIESPLVDLSKILQDTLHRWHICRSGVKLSDYVYDCFTDIVSDIRKYCKDEWEDQLNLMEFMTIARILPYCKNEDQFRWCQKILSRI